MTNTISGRVTRVIHHGYTYYGNPMKSVVLNGIEIYRLSDNAGLAYGIDNSEYRDEPHTFALTRAGRISRVIRENA